MSALSVAERARLFRFLRQVTSVTATQVDKAADFDYLTLANHALGMLSPEAAAKSHWRAVLIHPNADVAAVKSIARRLRHLARARRLTPHRLRQTGPRPSRVWLGYANHVVNAVLLALQGRKQAIHATAEVCARRICDDICVDSAKAVLYKTALHNGLRARLMNELLTDSLNR